MSRGGHSRRGGSTFGCLVSLVIFIGALYYGQYIGQIYVRYFRLRDAMRAQADLAPTLDDGVIGRRLTAQAESLFSDKRLRFRIRRTPTHITIQTEYTESVALPFYTHTFMLRPKVEEPL